MNTSNTEGECRFPEGTASYVDAVLFVIISVVAVFGNTLVFVSYVKYKMLRSVTNIFILSLSASDLFVAFVSVPYSFTILVCDIRNKVDQNNQDILYGICDMVPSIWSIYSLTLVALDRVLVISRPYVHQRYVTRKSAWISVGVIWMLALAFVSARFVMRTEFTLFIIMVAYVIPVCLMMVSYFIMGYVAHTQAKKLNVLDKTTRRLREEVTPQPSPTNDRKRTSLSNSCLHVAESPTINHTTLLREDKASKDKWIHRFILPNKVQDGVKQRSIRRELKSALTLSLILGCFTVSWTPFIASNIEFYACNECNVSPVMIKYFKILHYSNSALNPILYMLLNKQWRSAFRMILTFGNKRPAFSGGSSTIIQQGW